MLTDLGRLPYKSYRVFIELFRSRNGDFLITYVACQELPVYDAHTSLRVEGEKRFEIE